MRVPDKLIAEVLQEVVDKYLIPRFEALGMNATGKWIQGIEIDVQNGVGYIKGEHYTAQLVFGRRPQPKTHEERVKWAYWMVTYVKDFQDWLQVRGLTEHGFAIAYKLDKEGTTWYKKGGSNLLEILEEPTTMNYIYERIGSYYQIAIATELRRQAQEAFA